MSFIFMIESYYIIWVMLHFICPSVDGHMGCFHFLATINNAVMNICVQVFYECSSGYIFRNRVTGSYGNSMFNFLRDCQSFPQWLYHFIFSWNLWGFPVSLHPHQYIVCLFDYCHPSGCEVVSHYGFDLHFPND